jgi:hypothetical protein
MAFSFSRLIISESDSDTCKESFRLIGEKHPEARLRGTASCIGEIDGHKIWLGFEKGVTAWRCSCDTKDTRIKIIEPCAQ